VVHFRDILRRNLPVHLLDEDGFMRNDRFAICILASVGYEFAVALYAIFALGAVAVPLCR
jgi:acyl-CoA synthetase (AMP-forming)/AMP-acid ligase II